MAITNIHAVLFDMDGTLVDSELLTEKAVECVLVDHGLSIGNFDATACYGITWKKIEGILWSAFPTLSGHPLTQILQAHFHQMGLELKPAPIPGAQWAVKAASQVAQAAIGTSSNRESLLEVVQRLELNSFLSTTASAEDYTNSKPAPDCYLLLAKRLNIAPKNCLVFEDSIPGIQAAKAAGMKVIAITHRCHNLELARELADKTISNYNELPQDFFASICASDSAKRP